MEHEFDSSMTCNYCGVAEEKTKRGEPCPKRVGDKVDPPSGGKVREIFNDIANRLDDADADDRARIIQAVCVIHGLNMFVSMPDDHPERAR
jgi:hypothetical protein